MSFVSSPESVRTVLYPIYDQVPTPAICASVIVKNPKKGVGRPDGFEEKRSRKICQKLSSSRAGWSSATEAPQAQQSSVQSSV
jgi:hypothetical protein